MKINTLAIIALMATSGFAQVNDPSQKNPILAFAADRKVSIPSKAEYDPNVVLVAFHGQSRSSERANLLSRYGLTEDQDALNPYFSRLILPAGASVVKVIESLLAEPSIRVAEPDYIVRSMVTPNDPSYSSLWGMNQASDVDIDAPEGWDIQTGSSSVKVCVIDTGLDYNHADLSANSLANPGEVAGNGIDDDGNGRIDDIYGWDFVNNDGNPMDDNSHGTHCAGTIGARGNNGIGVVGVNWNVKIFAAKFLGAGGSGSTSNAVLCTDYARIRGANVMSNSWGGGGFSQLMLEAIQRAATADILFVAAAGNSATNNDVTAVYPANYNSPNVMAVANLTSSGVLSSSSGYGLTKVQIAAPGTSVNSTVPGGGYGLKSGTSMACPHVAGAAALLKAQNPALTYAQIKTKLQDGAVRTSQLNGKVTSGLLNIYNSLDRRVSGTVLLEGLNPAGKTVTFQVRALGSTTPIQTINVVLGAGGSYSFLTSEKVVRDISLKGRTHLRKTSASANLAGNVSSLNFTLKTGDVAEDNVVDLSDYTQIATAFNALPGSANWNAAADLNQDGVVDLTDYTFVATNFNAVGDN